MMTRFWCLAILVSLAVCAGQARRQEYTEQWRWAHFTTESGLPSNTISDVVETTDGVPWAATSGGLFWYDGFRWRPPKDTSLLPRERPSWLLADAGGRLITVIGGRIYAGDANRFERFDEGFYRQLDGAEAIVPIGKQAYMVFSAGSILRVRGGTAERVAQPSTFDVAGKRFFYTRGGGIWINTKDGIFRWDGTRFRLALGVSGKPMEILDLIEDDHHLTIASIAHPMTFRGIWRWKGDGTPVRDAECGRDFLRTMDVSPSGEVLAVYRSGELRRFRDGQWRRFGDTPPELTSATFVRFNGTGDLWAGSASGLYLYKHLPRRWKNWKHPFPNLDNTVNEIIMAKDSSIWLGTEGGVEVHAKDGTVRYIHEIGAKPIFVVTGLCEDADGSIWISSGSGFDGAFRWDGADWKHFGVEHGLGARKIHRIQKDRQGRLWFLGIGDGFTRADQEPGAYMYSDGRFTHWGPNEGLPNGRVYAFDQGPDGAFWFGTADGLCRWKDGVWKIWRNSSDGILDPRIFTLTVDRNNWVWFGHQVGGLEALDEHFGHHYYSAEDGLIGDDVWEVQSDKKGFLWVSTTVGLSCFHDGVWTSFSQTEGLVYPRIWPILALDNDVYVGTAGNGVSILNLGDLVRPDPVVEFAEPVTEENRTLIRWHAFSYWGDIPSSEILTRYRMDEDSWSGWTALHEAALADVASGTHRFQVQSQGLFGFSDSARRPLRVVVNGPFYRRTLFVVPVGILFMAVIVLGGIMLARNRAHARAIRESEARLRTVTEATSSAIFIDNGSRFQFVNTSAESLMECSRDELLRLGLTDIVNPLDAELLRKEVGGLPGTLSTSGRAEVRLMTRKGHERWADMTFGRIEYGGMPATLMTAVDITARREMDEKLDAYQGKLKSLASELTMTGERERRRMAAFLHDSICQSLIFCKMKLAESRESSSVGEIKSLMEDIDHLVDQSIESTQTLTFDLSPPILYELGFVQAVEWLVEHTAHEHHLPVAFSDDGAEKPLGEDIRLVLFQAVREALVNIVKHAHAETASVSLVRTGDRLVVSIEDDGIGFDASNHGPRGLKGTEFGLFNMRERVRYLGGDVMIESGKNRGTRLVLAAPLGDRVDADSGMDAS